MHQSADVSVQFVAVPGDTRLLRLSLPSYTTGRGAGWRIAGLPIEACEHPVDAWFLASVLATGCLIYTPLNSSSAPKKRLVKFAVQVGAGAAAVFSAGAVCCWLAYGTKAALVAKQTRAQRTFSDGKVIVFH